MYNENIVHNKDQGINALQGYTYPLLNGLEVLVLSFSIVPQEQYITLFRLLQTVLETRQEGNQKLHEPRVISASIVMAGDATSEGSTAARLEVASPKSPTSKLGFRKECGR